MARNLKAAWRLVVSGWQEYLLTNSFNPTQAVAASITFG